MLLLLFSVLSCTKSITYHAPHFLRVGLFAILSASLQALRFEVRSLDNFKDFKSQLTHCCQVFLGRPRSRLPATSCCVHFFIQSSLGQTWPNQRKRFVCSAISRFFKHSLFNKLSDDILSLIFTLHIQRIIARSFRWSLWTSLLLEHSVHCHTTLHYECSYFKLCLCFSRGLHDVAHETFPKQNGFLQRC